jgi:tRNA U34 5-carboxymethylaminomethyl modifying enzyme MnmG/GidA
VREIDVGGYWVLFLITAIQFKMLNKSKGPAMCHLVSQIRMRFAEEWRMMLKEHLIWILPRDGEWLIIEKELLKEFVLLRSGNKI